MIRNICAVVVGATAILAHDGGQHGKGHTKTAHHPAVHETVDIPSCKDGYVRNGGYCVRAIPIPKEAICPAGTLDDGTSCILFADGNVSCSSGKYIGDLFCEVSQTGSGRYECPKGSRQNGDECEVGGLLSYCPAGFAETGENKCIKTSPKQFTCPAGLKDTGDLCMETKTAPVELICPQNTNLINGKCEVEIAVEKVCPLGYADEGDQCAVFESPIRDVCPAGLTFDAAVLSCVKLDQRPSIATCQPGALLVGSKCETIIDAPLEKLCTKGRLVNGSCETSGVVPAQYDCPAGYTLDASARTPICINTVKYDCSYTQYKCADEPFHVATPKNTHPEHGHQKSGSHGGHNIPAKARNLKQVGPANHVHGHDFEHEKKHGYCHKEEIRVPKTCQETLTAEAIPRCQEGIFDGTECIVQDVFPPTERCTGIEKDSRCILVETYPVVFICPTGYSRIGSGATCEKLVQVVGPTERCPKETTQFQGRCSIFVAKECPLGGCSEIVTWAPEAICPVDFTLVLVGKSHSHYNKGHWSTKSVSHVHEKVEKQCIRFVYSEKTATCPAGTADLSGLSCASYTAVVTVDGQKSVPSQFICPVGFETIGKTCVQGGFVEAEVTCPVGYTGVLNSELCFKVEPEILRCPLGSHEIDGECFVDAQTQTLLVPKSLLKVPMKKHGDHTGAPLNKLLAAPKWPSQKRQFDFKQIDVGTIEMKPIDIQPIEIQTVDIKSIPFAPIKYQKVQLKSFPAPKWL